MTDPKLIELMNAKDYVISYDCVIFSGVRMFLTMTGKDALLQEKCKKPLGSDEIEFINRSAYPEKAVNQYTINNSLEYLPGYEKIKRDGKQVETLRSSSIKGLSPRLKKILWTEGTEWLLSKLDYLFSLRETLIDDNQYAKSSYSSLSNSFNFCVEYSSNSGFYVEVTDKFYHHETYMHVAFLEDGNYSISKRAIRKLSEFTGINQTKLHRKIEEKMQSLSNLSSFPDRQFIHPDSYVITDKGRMIFMSANKILKKIRTAPESCIKGTDEKILSYWVHPDERIKSKQSKLKKIKLSNSWRSC